MDFLTFDAMISIPVLIGFYYLGAVFCPLVMWRCMRWILARYPIIETLSKEGGRWAWQQLPREKKWKVIALFAVMFLMGELFWRMLFEYLIAFMQMRNAMVLQTQLHG